MWFAPPAKMPEELKETLPTEIATRTPNALLKLTADLTKVNLPAILTTDDLKVNQQSIN